MSDFPASDLPYRSKIDTEIKKLRYREEFTDYSIDYNWSKSALVHCLICDIDIKLGERHKYFAEMDKHIASSTHSVNLSLVNPDVETSSKMEVLLKKYPNMLLKINKTSLKCKVCTNVFLMWRAEIVPATLISI